MAKRVLTEAERAEKRERQAQRRLHKYEMDEKRAKILSYVKKEDWDNGIIALGTKNITLEIIENYSKTFAVSEEAHKKFMADLVEKSYVKVEKSGKTEITIIPSKARQAFIAEYFPTMIARKKATKSRSQSLYEAYKQENKDDKKDNQEQE